MSKTVVLKCDRKHKLQDEIHGESRRVHNETAKVSVNKKVYRCTVCGKER